MDIVSSSWLESQAGRPNHVVIDVRTAAEYEAGHIPGAVSIPFEVPFSAWVTVKDDLLLELPDAPELFRMLGSHGITRDSAVVIVTGVDDPPYPQAGGTRAAVTLMYAGVADVSVLDGGHPAWVAAGGAVSTEVPAVTPVVFDGDVGGVAFVDTDYVRAAVGRATIVDTRDASVYSGQVVEPFADKAGHLPTAVSMPVPSFFGADGSYRTPEELAGIAEAAIGRDRSREVVVYCGVGGYASTALFVLTRLLGYRDVKFYDGSAQEWVRHHDMELTPPRPREGITRAAEPRDAP